MYARSIKFTTMKENQDILKLPTVSAVLKEMTSADTDEEFEIIKANGIDVNVDVFTQDTRIQINQGIFNDLIENKLYSTNNISRINSIISEKPTNGVIVFTMADR